MWDVIAGFGAALALHPRGVYGISEWLLPHPRERIEQALRLALLTHQDDETLRQLEIGYLALARFVPDPEGTLVASLASGPAAADPGGSLLLIQAGPRSRLLGPVLEREKPIMDEIRKCHKLRTQAHGPRAAPALVSDLLA
jgi:hypothetical protein